MKKSVAPIIILIILAGVYGYLQIEPAPPIELTDPPEQPESPTDTSDAKTIEIAAFNIQIFGKTKRAKLDVMDVLADTVRQFDVVLVQEIRDSSETTAPIFLDHINAMDGPEYAFIRSERLGRSSSEETYA